jgi:hypothetical protein
MTTKNPAAVALGRRGGLATSPAKAAASKANGAKGGRPRHSRRTFEQTAICPKCGGRMALFVLDGAVVPAHSC